ncbi:MAG: phosphoribosylglycinamide formyltransferase [Tannerella sp.]|jgi:phosphoribosylglycinamide formyltransferase-1|nr:phosphoribosylglycinamide formyltransferase [Tannerella sp.]
MNNIAIFASGSGSNAENLINYFNSSDAMIRVAVVLSNRSDAGVHVRAERLGVPSFTFTNIEFKEGSSVLRKLSEYETHFIVLAGFLLKIPAVVIEAYPDRIINIHPSLLPGFGGKGMYGDYVHKAVVAAKETQTGITIHYVNEHYDEGAVIFQASCPVFPSDTADDVAMKVHELEYKNYPRIIEKLLSTS